MATAQPGTVKPDTPRSLGDNNAAHVSPVTPAEDMRTIMINRVSWGAVLAGTAVGLVTQVILSMIGIGIGAATLDPGTTDNPSASAFQIGAAIWFVFTGVMAALTGGFAAGRLAGKPKESTAGWHGLTAWAFSTLLVLMLLTSAVGGIVGTAYRGMASALGGIGSAATQAAAPAIGRIDPFAAVEETIRGQSDDANASRNAAVSSMRALLTGDPQQAQQARVRAAEALAKAQNIPVEDARKQIQQYEEQYRQAVEQAKAKATEIANKTAKAVSRAALLGAISLLLGAIAAWYAGRMGAVDPTITAYPLK
jgi:hypothetical protein